MENKLAEQYIDAFKSRWISGKLFSGYFFKACYDFVKPTIQLNYFTVICSVFRGGFRGGFLGVSWGFRGG